MKKAFWAVLFSFLMSSSLLNADIPAAMLRGLRYVEISQSFNGSWPMWQCAQSSMRECKKLDSAFMTAWILEVLFPDFNQEMGKTFQRAGDFIDRDQDERGLWKFFGKDSSMDADLDDTACNSYVLKRFFGENVSNQDYFYKNQNARQLFMTWVRDNSSRNDVDAVVNANVLLYLGVSAQTRPVVDFLYATIRENRETQMSLYYLNPLVLYYRLGKLYRSDPVTFAAFRPLVIGKIRKRLLSPGVRKSPMNMALIMIAWHDWGEKYHPVFKKWLQSLQKLQNKAGFWDPEVFFVGPSADLGNEAIENQPGVLFSGVYGYYGSRTLVTALVLGALKIYQNENRN